MGAAALAHGVLNTPSRASIALQNFRHDPLWVQPLCPRYYSAQGVSLGAAFPYAAGRGRFSPPGFVIPTTWESRVLNLGRGGGPIVPTLWEGSATLRWGWPVTDTAPPLAEMERERVTRPIVCLLSSTASCSKAFIPNSGLWTLYIFHFPNVYRDKSWAYHYVSPGVLQNCCQW